MLFPTNENKTHQQSLLSVFLQAIVYYDEILSYFLLIFQYLEFIYKYNILTYSSGTVAVELILLTLLLFLNPLRIASARVGNKGKKYLRLILFLVLDILFILGLVYVVALQSNALYVEIIIAIISLIFSGLDFVLALVLLIYYRCTEWFCIVNIDHFKYLKGSILSKKKLKKS